MVGEVDLLNVQDKNYEQMFWQIYLYHNLNTYNERMETEAKIRELAI